MITIPRKGSLPLSSSSIVKLSEGCISFSVNKNSEADETSGILLRVSLTYRLIFEMLFIRKLKPKLNKQSDSIRAKLFT